MNRELITSSLKIFTIAAFISVSAATVLNWVFSLFAPGQVMGEQTFLAMWAVYFICLMIMAFQPHSQWRTFWADFVAVMAFVCYFHTQIGTAQFLAFMDESIWSTAAGASIALAFYAKHLAISVGLAVFGYIAIAIRPPHMGRAIQGMIDLLKFAPALPVIAILGLFVVNAGSALELTAEKAPNVITKSIR